MQKFQGLLLGVWQEACRHIEITESAATVARMLQQTMPLQCLLVRRLDISHSAIETIAWGAPGENHFLPPSARTELTASKLKRLLEWASKGDLIHSQGVRRISEIALVTPDEIQGDVLLGPLMNPEGPAGVLVLVSESNRHFRPEHLALTQALIEPFSVALENDRRLHELAALREAAEADRRTLLHRLGRREMAETVVGVEAGLKNVMDRVELVSSSDAAVLILGETGTGKEVVARAIHTRSSRASGPFIRVNCGAIPHDLIDSQLFGHERGSFTGAADTRKGWFERADGGTLFLDEIGELPLQAQVRLLRVLQDGYIERVGGQQPIRVDVRIVAATHRDLPTMVKEGTFREDLWYRIAVFPILLPPLRDRLEDIPALARHFAERAANRFGLSLVIPTADDLNLLMNYRWPGNIRELGAVIDRAAILGNGVKLEVATALGADGRRTETAAPTIKSAILNAPHDGALDTLDDAMKKHIERALDATRGRIEGPNGTAALLGINPHTLRARMRKLKIDWNRYRKPVVSP
jgi:transcriptional regulator with GAF, ATPase, and Fis domain